MSTMRYSSRSIYAPAFQELRILRRSQSWLNHLQSNAAQNAPSPRRERSLDVLRPQQAAFIVDVEATREALLQLEDTDRNDQITIEDTGPKRFLLRTVSSDGYRKLAIAGTYRLANLLQSLTIARESSFNYIILSSDAFTEDPVDRLSRLISDVFWPNLTRHLDETMIEKAATDEKDWTNDPRPRVYVPMEEKEQYKYYLDIAQRRPDLRLDVQLIPAVITAEIHLEMQKKPGILALAMERRSDESSKEDTIQGFATAKSRLEGVPFVVPGGRFNELYGWDSYFTALGLISDGRTDLAKGILRNFVFEIQHYGLIPNANRSYYLLRSQPPFLTNFALRVYEATSLEADSSFRLKQALLAAIKEYHQVWMSDQRLDRRTGLSKYRPHGFGIPMETEEEHFDHVLEPYAKERGMSVPEFRQAYNEQRIQEPELDVYFLHDRGVRESGHDVSVRLEFVCANTATIDLNCCLYKYESDIAYAIRTFFNDHLVVPPEFCAPGQIPNHAETSREWDRRARQRKLRIDHYLWNSEKGSYFDYNCSEHRQSTYNSATCFWAMWCGVASPNQAASLVSGMLPLFERVGGLSVGTEHPGRRECHDSHQWDFPYGWAPHQVLAWDGLRRYGYTQEAERLAYRWLHLITKMYVDYGVVVEKYDVTNLVNGHKVFAEYGNQGLNFVGYAKEGFGWTNASYQYGLQLMSSFQRRALGVCAPYEVYERSVSIMESKFRGELHDYRGSEANRGVNGIQHNIATHDDTKIAFTLLKSTSY